MKPEDRDKAIISDNLPQIRPKKNHQAITVLKHRVAVQNALKMIEARMQDPPSLGELAHCSGLSPTYFSHVFKAVTGMRFQDYLTKIRLNKAKHLLKNINLRIKKIAHESGFKDPNHFCRIFKRRTGLNPTNWRLRNLRKKV